MDQRKNNGKVKGTKNKVKGKIINADVRQNSSKVKRNTYQAEKSKEFLEPKEGESQEDWAKRTQKRRVFGVIQAHHITLKGDSKLIIRRRGLNGTKKNLRATVVSEVIERTFDYMANYAFIMRWASIKYGITQDDFELGFYLYNKGQFTREEFDSVCISLGSVRGVFVRFIREGLIIQYKLVFENNVEKKYEIYSLSQSFLFRIDMVYKAISRVQKMSITVDLTRRLNPELNEFLMSLNDEIESIINGRKNSEKIKV